MITRGRLTYAYHIAAESKLPLRLVTLTYSKDVDKRFVIRSLQHLAQAMRRRFQTFEYARFPEYTKKGRIHLHLVVLSPFIPQKILSQAWKTASRGAYVVDIRKVENVRHLSTYVAKYVAKRPAGKVTYSRHFPDRYPSNCLSPHPAKSPNFSYRWMNILDAAIECGASLALWTGEPQLMNGP